MAYNLLCSQRVNEMHVSANNKRHKEDRTSARPERVDSTESASGARKGLGMQGLIDFPENALRQARRIKASRKSPIPLKSNYQLDGRYGK